MLHYCQNFLLLLLLLLHQFNGLFSRTTWVSRYQQGKTSLDLNEERDGEVLGWQWTICKQSAPRCRQMTTPTPHHSIFIGQCSSWCPNNSIKALLGSISELFSECIYYASTTHPVGHQRHNVFDLPICPACIPNWCIFQPACHRLLVDIVFIIFYRPCFVTFV